MVLAWNSRGRIIGSSNKHIAAQVLRELVPIEQGSQILNGA